MLMQIMSQFRRRPLPPLAVVLFAVVISFALGGLQRANDAEQASFEEAFETTPVYFAVTDFRGQPSTQVWSWLCDPFLGRGYIEPYLDEYVGLLRMEMTAYIDGDYADYTLCGITSAVTAPLLDSACGGEVTWFEGFDESIFERTLEEGDLLCVIPETLYETLGEGATEIELQFASEAWNSATGHDYVTLTLTIAGTYAAPKQEFKIFCPYDVARRRNAERDRLSSTHATGVSGILNDNHRLEEFKAAAANWFGEVNPEGKATPWGKWGYEYYLYAIDVDDSVLQRLARNYQISIFINEMSSMLVLAFCTAAGFLIGFLLIRSRKREIGLMRTLGGSNFHIYLGFAAEQLLCIAAGIAVGGALMSFNAPRQLALFALVYFVGLSAALIVFLNKNLLSGLKEE